ncbi:peptidoglycan endopeptidase [Sphingomonas montana]|uniref:peptidoglycan endopeptidase n=1 Tax=Sphingomonas montana TaxID=1843236 RepID=UPI001F0AD680|nr:peptidoglycan endopeptidase [Sphingomonas montana]
MMNDVVPNDVVARAHACIGVRFRPQGRVPAYGLDCVGLIAFAGRLPGEKVPARYAMRGGTADDVAAQVNAAGLVRLDDMPGPGAVVLVEAGPRQFHLLILMADGFVHADAGIGRIVAVPGIVPWPVIACWRYKGG